MHYALPELSMTLIWMLNQKIGVVFPPKWMVKIMETLWTNGWFGGIPIFLETPIWTWNNHKHLWHMESCSVPELIEHGAKNGLLDTVPRGVISPNRGKEVSIFLIFVCVYDLYDLHDLYDLYIYDYDDIITHVISSFQRPCWTRVDFTHPSIHERPKWIRFVHEQPRR